MPPELVVVNAWKGLDRRGPGAARSERRGLDSPRVLTNFLLDDNQHLYMPPAVAESVHTFTGEGSILAIRYSENPGGVLVQTETKIHFIPRGGSAPAVAVTPTVPHWKIWAVSIGNKTVFGYGARGTASDSQTFELSYNSATETYSITEITEPEQPPASYSVMYKGRRFAMFRGRVVRFSNLNEPMEWDLTSGSTDNEFNIGGDDGGNNLVSNPGVVKGMISWEDVLIMFLTGSVWTLTGSGPDTWYLRQNMTLAGNTSEWSLVPMEGGVMSYGGSNLQDEGFYLFTGNETRKISHPVDDLVPLWISGKHDIEREPRFDATFQHDHYIVSLGRALASDTQFLLWNAQTGHWLTFDGFVKSCYCPVGWGSYYADGLTLLFDDIGRTFKRKSGRNAVVTVGYDDDGVLGAMTRFIGVKLFGKKTGGTPTVTISVLTDEGDTVTSDPFTLTTDSFNGVMIPINVRGNAVQITMTVTPSGNSDTVLIESFQLIKSTKGLKPSTV